MSNSNPHPISNNLNASVLVERLRQGEELLLIDVREPIEFHTYNIGGMNIPLGLLHEQIEDLDINTDQEIIVLCKVGLRSKTAQKVLQQLGYTQVRNLEGGLMAIQKIK
ncbi:hypothetical protein GCM10027037_09500 [Mucilaginibacter koreensis]